MGSMSSKELSNFKIFIYECIDLTLDDQVVEMTDLDRCLKRSKRKRNLISPRGVKGKLSYLFPIAINRNQYIWPQFKVQCKTIEGERLNGLYAAEDIPMFTAIPYLGTIIDYKSSGQNLDDVMYLLEQNKSPKRLALRQRLKGDQNWTRTV